LLADVFGCDLGGPPRAALTWLAAEPGSEAPEIAAALDGECLLFRETPTYVPVQVREAASVGAVRFRPPFETVVGSRHTSHGEPPYRKTGEPLLVTHRYGKGRCVYFATRPGSAYLNGGYHDLRHLLYHSLRWAAGKDVPLSTDAPYSVETLLCRQGDRLVLHLLNFSSLPAMPATVMDFPPQGFGPIQKGYVRYAEAIPLRQIGVTIRTERPPAQIYLAPSRTPLTFSYDRGQASFTIDTLQEAATAVVAFAEEAQP
jgi:hypothetical protein